MTGLSALKIFAAVAAIGLYAADLPAARAADAIARNATAIVRLAQGDGYRRDDNGGYRPVCPYRYYYTCWYDPRGNRHCGCLPGIGYYLFGFN